MTVNKILKIWLCDGDKTSHDGVPLHPEFVYRKSGHWKGWSEFLGSKNTKEDSARDTLEDKAFSLYKQSLN